MVVSILYIFCIYIYAHMYRIVYIYMIYTVIFVICSTGSYLFCADKIQKTTPCRSHVSRWPRSLPASSSRSLAQASHGDDGSDGEATPKSVDFMDL